MIYTLTMNPSLDYVMEIENLSVGVMNRSSDSYLLPGGKGINVSYVLNNLEIKNTAILPVAGFTGEKLLQMLSSRGISYEAVRLSQGDTRINVKVLCQAETELNAQGPQISENEEGLLYAKLKQLKDGDYLVLSGSVPGNLGEHFYAEIMGYLAGKGIKVVVDTIGANFLNALRQIPFLVKPNKEELETIMGQKADAEEKILELAKKVQSMGAKNVLVSLGSNGAILLTEDGHLFRKEAPKGNVVNTVGAGDSMVAGFLAGYIKTGNMESALKWGVAAGSAGAFSKNPPAKEEIDALLEIL